MRKIVNRKILVIYFIKLYVLSVCVGVVSRMRAPFTYSMQHFIETFYINMQLYRFYAGFFIIYNSLIGPFHLSYFQIYRQQYAGMLFNSRIIDLKDIYLQNTSVCFCHCVLLNSIKVFKYVRCSHKCVSKGSSDSCHNVTFINNTVCENPVYQLINFKLSSETH